MSGSIGRLAPLQDRAAAASDANSFVLLRLRAMGVGTMCDLPGRRDQLLRFRSPPIQRPTWFRGDAVNDAIGNTYIAVAFRNRSSPGCGILTSTVVPTPSTAGSSVSANVRFFHQPVRT